MQIQEILITQLAPSPTNPRKTFHKKKLEELAESIRSKGILQALLVREKKIGKASYEVVAGERRYRAAKIVGSIMVPCVVKELTDVEVLEVQTIENLQRDDLHPLEEADGFAALMKEAGYDVAKIAERIGRDPTYVYDRLSLLGLSLEGRRIFLAGEITVTHAVLLARLSQADQARAIGSDSERWGRPVSGLFQADHGRDDPGLELDDERDVRKAVSVREFQTWIDEHVRFKPADVDLPNLFPATAVALAQAADEDLKVIKITRDYRVQDDARDEKERTYGEQSWKRADGELDEEGVGRKRKPSKTCERSVLGLVVAGPGRGEAFQVCVDKKRCKVHWGDEIREAEKRAKGGGSKTATPKADDYAAQNKKREEQHRREEEERKRWEKAAPALRAAVAEKLNKGPISVTRLLDIVLADLRVRVPAGVERGKTAEDALRYLAFGVLSGKCSQSWYAARDLPKVLKPFGLDATKIMRKANGVEEENKAAPAAKAAKKKRGAS